MKVRIQAANSPAVMIVSTLNGGGHYLADVIAGIVLVVTLIIVHGSLYRDLTPA